MAPVALGRRGLTMMLEVKNLSKYFGGLAAVVDVNLTVDDNELVSIIGPNGAGKSTLFNLITGHLAPDKGRVVFQGKDITRQKPHQISRRGIGRSFQKVNIFPRLSAFQNIQVALFSSTRSNRNLLATAAKKMNDEVAAVLEGVGLARQAETLAGLLAHGDQKRLEMGIALALNPKLLLLDEPTQGMSPGETSETTELIRQVVRDRGIGLAFVEHDMKVVFGISDRISVMHQGRIIFSGRPDEVRDNEEVQNVYLGQGGEA